MTIKTILIAILASAGAFAQVFPGAVAGDADLYVVGDNVQSTLSTAMALGDNVAIVASGSGWQPNMLATICDTTVTVAPGVSKCATWEHMLVTAVNGQALTVIRGKAGSTAAPHSVGKVISGSIDADHHNAVRKELKAIEAAIGPRGIVNTSHVGQGAYVWQWLDPQWTASGTPNTDAYFGFAVTTTPGNTASGNIVGIYSAIETNAYQSGAKQADIWAANFLVAWNPGDPDTNIQILELDYNNLHGDTFGAIKGGLNILNGYTYKGGTGISVGTVVPGASGKWRTGLQVLDYSDVGVLVGGTHPGSYYPSPSSPISMLIRQDYSPGEAILIQRSTDSAPEGYFMRFVNAASSLSLMTWDVNGNLSLNAGGLYIQPLTCPAGKTAPISINGTGQLVRGTCI